MTGAQVSEIFAGGVLVKDAEGKETRLKADTIVNTLGIKPVNTLEAELKDCGAEVIAIGDVIAPANIQKATAEAYKAANDI